MSKAEAVAQILSERVAIRKQGSYGPGFPSLHWSCPCGNAHIKMGKAPMTVRCHYCNRRYTLFDPEEEDK